MDLGFVTTERDLIGLCRGLGASEVVGLSEPERILLRTAPRVPESVIAELEALIAAGRDPLGDLFCAIRSPEQRRPTGATYTPAAIVRSMLAWTRGRTPPAQVIDPGAGSARFLIEAATVWPDAKLIGVDTDPIAALMARASLRARGLASRAAVFLTDYRLGLPTRRGKGPTLFIGNPPYVRHHQIEERWKQWLTTTARKRGLPVSQLAGLHVHFFLATIELAAAGDYGAFVTAAEWLDVNYGALVRELFLGELGGLALHVIDPKAMPFADAAATASIACFEVGTRPTSIYVRRVDSLDTLGYLEGGQPIRRERIEAARRWTPLTAGAREIPHGFVELGELCRVRRGQVTGANDFWIHGDHSRNLPVNVLFPSVTRARELFAVGAALRHTSPLRRVIDVPEDLDAFSLAERKAIYAFLESGKRAGVDQGYIARHRRKWWHVGLYDPAPILATYMARRPPGFVRNFSGARHINIAHGIYPREHLSDVVLDRLVTYLSANVSLRDGRTYAGGLVKFEPREMERVLVPSLEQLAS
jgi:adenine-specific DNA-methyltransferase